MRAYYMTLKPAPLLSSACQLSLCLAFSFSSHLIVLVEVARVEVGSSERVVLAFLTVEAGRQGRLWVLAIKAGSRSCHQGGVSVVPSRRVLGGAIKACTRQGEFGI